MAEKYVEELAQQIHDLLEVVQQAKENGHDLIILQEAIDYAHKLRETSDQYELFELNKAIGKVEDALCIIQTSKYIDTAAGSSAAGKAGKNGGSSEASTTTEPQKALRDTGDGPGNRTKDTTEDIWQQILETLPQIMVLAKKASAEAIEAQQAKAVSTIIKAHKGVVSPQTFTQKLLVFDDDKPFLDFIEKFAVQKLVNVLKVRTAEEALQRAKTVIVDAAMLGIHTGADSMTVDLAAQLRQLHGYENLPLAFVCENAQIYNRIAAAQAGACVYLTKPISNLDLDVAFQQLFADKEQRQARILVLDDDEALSSRTASVLEHEGMQVATLNDPVRILDVLNQFSPDLLLMDVMMPGISGLDVCRMLRTTPHWLDLPIIFLSSETSPEVRSATFKQGGNDYLVKPCIDEELVSRIKTRLDEARTLKEKSRHDVLSGLLLRPAFMEQLNAMINSAQHLGAPVSICLFDIDYFKSINHQYGYQAGDNVLSNIGQLLKKRFGKEELAGRWGADEFIIAFYGKDKRAAMDTMKPFLSEFNQIEHICPDNRVFSTTTSAAFAAFPNDGNSASELIGAADDRLADIKEDRQDVHHSEVRGKKS